MGRDCGVDDCFMGYSVWIQDVDFEPLVEKPVSTARSAILTLTSHDWPRHLDRYEEQRKVAPDACPPAFGISEDEQGTWLRILPQKNGAFDIAWDSSVSTDTAETRTPSKGQLQQVSAELTLEAIEHFLAQNLAWFKDTLAQSPN